MDIRQFRIIAILLAVIGAALLTLVLVLVFSGDDEPAAAPTIVTNPTIPVPPTTPPPPPPPPPPTPAPIPTIPPDLPTLPPAPTTAAPPEPTTIAPPPPTTALPLPLPLVLQDDGIGGVPFGSDPATAIAYAESVLGPADNDTGWIDSFAKYGVCPEPQVRGVEWGGGGSGFGFALLFTMAPTSHLPGGGEHLFGYYYFGDPGGLLTEGGITTGSTLAAAQAAHPGSTVEEHPLVPGSSIWMDNPDPTDHALLWGFADGVTGDSALISVNGGETCGE